MKKFPLPLAALAVLLLSTGCQNRVTQEQLLQGTARDVITPLYEEAAAETLKLSGAAETCREKPTPENLQLLRSQWKKAAVAWQRTEPFRLGPATDLWLSNKIGYQNIRPATIDANVAKVGTPDETKLSAAGASAKGLFAIEYLLFQPNGTPKTPSEKDHRYLAAAALDASLLTRQLADAWSSSGKNYSQTFSSGGQASLNKLLNGMIESIERLKEKRIARLLGREVVWGDDSDTPPKKEASIALDGEILAAPLEGIERLLSAPSSTGEKKNLFLAYLQQTGSPIGPDYFNQTKKCIGLTRALPTPLEAAASRPALENDYAEVKKLVALSKSSLISALGVTLTFNSNDGD